MLPLTLVFFDLDNFKSVNDSLGHHSGDMVLKVMGWTMQHMLREADSVARLGGDKFALLLPKRVMIIREWYCQSFERL